MKNKIILSILAFTIIGLVFIPNKSNKDVNDNTHFPKKITKEVRKRGFNK